MDGQQSYRAGLRPPFQQHSMSSTTNQRYIRYALLAFLCLVVVYFISSASAYAYDSPKMDDVAREYLSHHQSMHQPESDMETNMPPVQPDHLEDAKWILEPLASPKMSDQKLMKEAGMG